MTLQAQVLYDFAAQPGSGEISITVGELVTITRQDVGEGWWEGINERGESGLFPETYVQICSGSGPPDVPPPPLPPGFNAELSPSRSHSYHTGLPRAESYQSNPAPPPPAPDDYDDDWSDDDTNQSVTRRASLALRAEYQRESVDSAATSSSSRRHSSNLTLEDSDLNSSARRHSGSRSTSSTPSRCKKTGGRDKSSAPRSATYDAELNDKSAAKTVDESGLKAPKLATGDSSQDEADVSLDLPAHPKEDSTAQSYVSHSGKSASAAVSNDQTAPVNRGGTVKKNINRFSNFVKSGTESFLLGSAKPAGGDKREKIAEIILGPEGICWKLSGPAYTCRVDSPKKSSKLKGLKSFISYQLTPTLTGIQVSRRYKHFDWLHARLVEKFSFLPIPPLPEKQVSGRYEEEFIEHRMAILQVWIDKICRHPILSHCDVWLHFITCTDDKKWKVGKRQAEKDEFIGGLWFLNVVTPAQSLDLSEIEQKVETFGRMAKNLDDSVKNFSSMIGDSAKKMQGPYKREYQKMATAFRLLGQAFEMDLSRNSSLVITEATKGSADCYDAIAQLFASQSRIDLEPLIDALFAYKGILASVPDMINTYRSAMGKLRDHQKLMEEGRCSRDEFEAIRSRVDVISYVMLAEMSHFQSERIHDFNDMLASFLRSQVSFYQQIVTQLQVALKQFGVNNNK